MQSTTLTDLAHSKVLGKRKAAARDAYVLHLASSPEPSGEQSDLELAQIASMSRTKLPVLVNGKLKAPTKRIYACTHDGCLKTYSKPSRLAEHERSHTGERPFICSTCNKSYLRETHLHAHERSHLPVSARPFACDVPNCEKRFWTSQHLRVHTEWHNGSKPFNCPEENCDEAFAKQCQLRAHASKLHSPPGTKPYQCNHDDCTKSFSTNQHLKAHLKTHEEKRYTCVHPTCLPAVDHLPTYFTTWSALQHHMRSSHPPSCSHPKCKGKTFSTQKGLRAHQKLHEQCDMDERVQSEDDEGPPRKRRRGGELGRDWRCQVLDCGKDFKSEKALRVHNNVTHLGKREHVCPHADCQRAFGYKHLLQRHVAKIHSRNTSSSSSSSSESETQDDLSDSEDLVPVPKTVQVDIDAITGKTYAVDAQTKLRQFKAMKCPFPHLEAIVQTQQSLPHPQGSCDYVFSRAYDLRRHLGAVHEVEVDQETMAQWVKLKKASLMSSDP